VRRAVLALVLLGACSGAAADPVSLIGFVASALSAGGFITALQAAAITFTAAVIGSHEARRKQRAAQARARAAYNASLQDRTATVLRADPPWRVIVGRAITGGDVVAIFTSDKAGIRNDGSSYTKPDALKHLVILLSCRRCQAINEVYIDGVALGALDGSGAVTGGEFNLTRTVTRELLIAAGASSPAQASAVTVQAAWDTVASLPNEPMVAGTYSLSAGDTVITNTGPNQISVAFTMTELVPSVRVQKHLGDQTNVDAYLTGVVPAEWTVNDKLLGLTYAVVTLDLENQRFQGGPPNITFDITGALVYDPRNATTAWSDNPALCLRDALTFEGGYDCADEDVDDATVITAANACDPVIALNTGGSITYGRTYTCNGVWTTDQVLQDLAESMAGTATCGARWMLQAGAWAAPVMALTDDDLHGQIEVVQGGAGLDDTFNTVRGQYVPAGGSAPADFDVYSSAVFVAYDGATLVEDRALPFTDDKARCRNLARIFVERNRDSLVIRYPAKLRAWPLQVGDRVSVTSTEYGFAAKTFQVTDWQFGLASPVTLLLQEDTAAAYDLADAASSDPARNTALPNPWVVAAPSSVTVTSGSTVLDGTITSRVRVGWAAVTDPYLADGSGEVLIRWRRQMRDPANVWQALSPVPASEVYAWIYGVDGSSSITVEVRFRNGVGALSAPVYASHNITDNATALVTEQIAPEAATVVLTATGSGGTLTSTEADIAGSEQVTTLCSVSYTNDTDAGVTLQVEAQVSGKFTETGGAGGTRYAWFVLEGGSLTATAPRKSDGTIPVVSVGDATEKTYTLIDQVSLASAASITVLLRARAWVNSDTTPDNTVTNAYSPSRLRVAVVKR
jgi:hypothetical protein